MGNQNEDVVLSHEKDKPPSAWRAPAFLVTPEAMSKIASELHRWGRMTGAFSIIAMMLWLVLGAVPASPVWGAVRSSLLWPGVALAVLAVTGLVGGFCFDYRAGQ